MVVDTSAIIAILAGEPEAVPFAEAIDHAQTVSISAASYVECGIVVDRNGNALMSRRFDDLIRDGRIQIEPLTINQARMAREAYRDFEKVAAILLA